MTHANNNTSPAQFYLDQLAPLVGGTITGTVETEPNDIGDVFFGLVVTTPAGARTAVLFLRDDEGNGPGSFEFQDLLDPPTGVTMAPKIKPE